MVGQFLVFFNCVVIWLVCWTGRSPELAECRPYTR